MAEGEDSAPDGPAEREAKRQRRQQQAPFLFAKAQKAWVKGSTDENEAALLRAAVPVAWTVQERCTGYEAQALSFLLHVIEDALAGNPCSSFKRSREHGAPSSQMERVARAAAITYMAHAYAGLLSIRMTDAKKKVCKIYGMSERTAHRWRSEAKKDENFYGVRLLTYDNTTDEEAESKRRERTDSLEGQLAQLASFIRKAGDTR